MTALDKKINQLAAFQRHGWHWRCSIRVNFAVCRRGQILHLTG